MDKKLLKKFWYIPVIIILFIYLIYQNVDFKIRNNDTSFFHNCLLTGLMNSKYIDKAGAEATIYVCRKAEEIRGDRYIAERGRVWK